MSRPSHLVPRPAKLACYAAILASAVSAQGCGRGGQPLIFESSTHDFGIVETTGNGQYTTEIGPAARIIRRKRAGALRMMQRLLAVILQNMQLAKMPMGIGILGHLLQTRRTQVQRGG